MAPAFSMLDAVWRAARVHNGLRRFDRALIAPFAFLGPDYDERLKQIYTSGEAENLIGQPNPLGLSSAPGCSIAGGCANLSSTISTTI